MLPKRPPLVFVVGVDDVEPKVWVPPKRPPPGFAADVDVVELEFWGLLEVAGLVEKIEG